MLHLPLAHHETSKHDSPNETKVKKTKQTYLGFEFKPRQVNDSSQSNQVNSILLRNAWGRKLLINPILKAKLIERGISELSLIVTANGFQAVGMLIIQPQSQELKVLKY
jgi:hypothetical protein